MTAGSRRLAWLAAATLVVFAANRWLSVPIGLNAVYFTGPAWQDAHAASFLDDAPSTALLKARRPDYVNQPFSVEWSGFILVPRSGTYTFRVVSDDGSWVYVHGREVVSNGGRHSPLAADGRVALDFGVHSLFIRYFQGEGDCAFTLSWSRDGRTFTPVPSWALLPDRVPYAQVVAHRLTTAVLAALAIAWYALLLGFVATRGIRWAGRTIGIRAATLGPAARGVLVAALLVNACGIWWAMPNERGWAPDEVVPADVLTAVQAAFAHGWHEKYPPFHYAVLAVADAPLFVLSSLGLIDLNTTAVHVTLVLLGRLVSLAYSAATILVLYECGLELYEPRGALFAALATAVTVPFAYYSKLANLDVPYLCWFAISLLAYIRILRHHHRRDYLLFAVSAVLATCTKDQAAGLYALTPLAIIASRWRAKRPLFDRVVWQAVAAGLLTFVVADDLIFNLSGFVAHVRLVLGTPAPFREFPATLAGQLQMAGRAIQEMRYMLGWPLAIVAAIAVVRGIVRRPGTPALPWLLVPAVSYYIAFVGTILFFFDRYLLPITMVVSLFVGEYLNRFVAPGVRARRTRLALVFGVFAYSAVYALGVDYAMTFDSRYTISRWLEAHADRGEVIASLGPLEYAMLADDFGRQSVESVDDVAAVRPRFVVLNADQMPTLPPGVRKMHESLEDGSAGYRLAFRYRTRPLPLPGQHPDLGDAPRHGPEFSDLSMINPTIEVFERSARASVAAVLPSPR